MFSIFTTSVFVTLLTAAVDDAAGPERDVRREFLQKKAAEFSLRGVGRDAVFQLTPKPVLAYTNPERERGTTHGATFLWLDNERPVAVASYSIRRPDESVAREFTSLTASPLECRKGQQVVWTPRTGGAVAQPIENAPRPAKGKAIRLAQMRSLARRFNATCIRRRSGEVTQLRFLPQPLYRFQDAGNGVTDGVIFAFVVSNDPELLLMLEAVENAQGAGSWRYSLSRMTSFAQRVQFDGKSVWTIQNYYKSGRSPEGPYQEGREGNYSE